jgi:hypothetical protein
MQKRRIHMRLSTVGVAARQDSVNSGERGDDGRHTASKRGLHATRAPRTRDSDSLDDAVAAKCGRKDEPASKSLTTAGEKGKRTRRCPSHTSRRGRESHQSSRRRYAPAGDCNRRTGKGRGKGEVSTELAADRTGEGIRTHPNPSPASVPTLVCSADSPPCGPPPTPPK